MGKVQVSQIPELGDPGGDGAVEVVGREVEELESGDGTEGGDEAAGEGVVGEGEVAEGFEGRESGKLEFAGEAEAGERDGDDGGAGEVADDAMKGGRAGEVGRRGVPGGEDEAGGVRDDALLELEEGSEVG